MTVTLSIRNLQPRTASQRCSRIRRLSGKVSADGLFPRTDERHGPAAGLRGQAARPYWATLVDGSPRSLRHSYVVPHKRAQLRLYGQRARRHEGQALPTRRPLGLNAAVRPPLRLNIKPD
jgi:hypothetical protein